MLTITLVAQNHDLAPIRNGRVPVPPVLIARLMAEMACHTIYAKFSQWFLINDLVFRNKHHMDVELLAVSHSKDIDKSYLRLYKLLELGRLRR